MNQCLGKIYIQKKCIKFLEVSTCGKTIDLFIKPHDASINKFYLMRIKAPGLYLDCFFGGHEILIDVERIISVYGRSQLKNHSKHESIDAQDFCDKFKHYMGC